MDLLVFNCGSSSLNYKIYQVVSSDGLKVVGSGKAHRVGVHGSEPSFVQHNRDGQTEKQVTPIPNHRQAAILILEYLRERGEKVDCIGHRIVHGGSYFLESTWVTPESLARFELCLPLSPVHNPNAMSVIEECLKTSPGLPQYLSFDTAFHARIPYRAHRYAIPDNLVEKYHLRRYGFHGLSYQYVTQEIGRILNTSPATLRLVACHLGTGGSSVAAIQDGHSVDTSMGYTPVAGVMMSTRTGDLDPMLPSYLMRTYGLDAEAFSDLIFLKSGLLGVSGFSSDLRDLQAGFDTRNDPRAALAFEMYAYQIKKVVGAYISELGGIDALIFTDDIGVQNARVRQLVCRGMEWCGIILDEQVNNGVLHNQTTLISAPESRVKVFAMPTDEELVLVREGLRLLQGAGYVHP